MSSSGLRGPAILRAVRGLARRSLIPVSMSALLGGCLDPPPEYSAPERLPPVITVTEVTPALDKVTTLQSNSKFPTFSVPFRSDDAGEELWAAFVIDYESSGEHLEEARIIPPDDRPFLQQGIGRSISFDWVPTRTYVGCHTMTLILSHRSNFEPFTLDTTNSKDVAEITWWLAIDSDKSTVCWPTGANP